MWLSLRSKEALGSRRILKRIDASVDPLEDDVGSPGPIALEHLPVGGARVTGAVVSRGDRAGALRNESAQYSRHGGHRTEAKAACDGCGDSGAEVAQDEALDGPIEVGATERVLGLLNHTFDLLLHLAA